MLLIDNERTNLRRTLNTNRFVRIFANSEKKISRQKLKFGQRNESIFWKVSVGCYNPKHKITNVLSYQYLYINCSEVPL